MNKEKIKKRYNQILYGTDNKHKLFINLVLPIIQQCKANNIDKETTLKAVIIAYHDKYLELINENLKRNKNETKTQAKTS